ncbi:MAG: hypothetical protein ACRETG_11955, partial [Steroidobacteraceae bacterium]
MSGGYAHEECRRCRTILEPMPPLRARKVTNEDPRTDAGRAADPGAARAAAIALLARRDFASGELRERLASRGFGAPA